MILLMMSPRAIMSIRRMKASLWALHRISGQRQHSKADYDHELIYFSASSLNSGLFKSCSSARPK